MEQLGLILAFRTIRSVFTENLSLQGAFPLAWLKASILSSTEGPPSVVGLPNLMKVLRTLSARVSLFLTLSRLRLQFLLLLEATLVVGSDGAKASGNTPTGEQQQRKLSMGNSMLSGNGTLGGQRSRGEEG